jgi:hypothetical protein
MNFGKIAKQPTWSQFAPVLAILYAKKYFVNLYMNRGVEWFLEMQGFNALHSMLGAFNLFCHFKVRRSCEGMLEA